MYLQGNVIKGLSLVLDVFEGLGGGGQFVNKGQGLVLGYSLGGVSWGGG